MNNKKKYLIALIAFVVCSAMFFLAIKAQRMYANNVTNKQASQSKDEDTKKAPKAAEENKKEGENSAKPSDTPQSTDSSKAADKAKDSTKSGEKTANNQTSTVPQENKAVSNDSKGSVTAEATVPKQSTATPKPDEEATFVFIDTVNGNRVILQKHVDIEGETVGYITCKLLDEAKINYRTTGSASTLYFAAIDGLEEKKAGRLSGWCYYVKKKGDTRFHKPNVGSGQWTYKKGDIVVWKYLADGIHDGYSDDWDK
ncbi:DUF4430 domain-containing protein [Clostridium aciditolerans]|uniref:DUF4430 domain-containing protein n=1 Tax=Clostridium aciditolerans TaxID=339861 RepID=A0A934HRC5_9CLOT|nr:DUF4430 domain-containing protein [Clostridium aciditolerans]MBI6871878.1 DUF4430 domain-containing protein [Clostridium aciditolerans]